MLRKPAKEWLQIGVRFVVRQGLADGKTEPGPGLTQDLIEELGHARRSASLACPDRKALGNRCSHGGVFVLRKRGEEREVVRSAAMSCDSDGACSLRRFASQQGQKVFV